jgi:hypothetical protein
VKDRKVKQAVWELVLVGGIGPKKSVKEGKYGGNIYSCMKMK